jgi:D-glycero-alpha-D-manno-heptose 1-phosphate guanylyltransferase
VEAIILAGGLGERLRSRVPDVPKPLAPVRSRPFLAYLLDYLISQGICAVTLAVGHGGRAIREWFTDRYRTVPIRYSDETQPLGTGGALKRALSAVTADPVFVVNGDTFVQVDYRRMGMAHHRTGASVTMAVKHLEDTSRYGRVQVKAGLVTSFEARGQKTGGYINAGVYVVSRSLFEGLTLPEKFSFERDFLEREAGRLQIPAFEVEGFFIDIGVPDDYDRAQRELPEWM